LDLLADNYPAPRNQLEDLFEVLANGDLDASLSLINDLKLEEKDAESGQEREMEAREAKEEREETEVNESDKTGGGSLNDYLT